MTNTNKTTVTREQNAIIASATALRAKAFAVSSELGCEYTLALADGWNRNGIAGVRAACWSLAEMVAEVPGGWDLYVAARNLSIGC